MYILKYLFIVLLCCWSLNAYGAADITVSTMQQFGFHLVKKNSFNIPYAADTGVHYIFQNRTIGKVIIDEYTNGFLELTIQTPRRKEGQLEWQVGTTEVINKAYLYDTLQRLLYKGN